ncbi:hypothetical protein ELQ35_10660 [Peribacillus cavernae]|uniref:YaaC family protein n=1 Tax=Peribacillus cavernae TaxID=1674310 RepID=A0A433HLA4_9BACI|nr:YaaC family protein [Peribacillus cavernae]RUQ29138.1 hypothetical protein ELQ35_10660 [Peribacillus cavernae]
MKNDVWNSFIYFFSASSTQTYLKKCYAEANIMDKEKKSFENCYPFIYYIEHAQAYYNQAAAAPLSIQPILSFYGFIQLLKACLLTIDPNYPESTSVLAHGVTTRKRKKQQYEFIYDEVKVQKNGLFTYMAEKMFHLKHLDGEKFSMGELLKELPELEKCFQFLHSKSNFKTLIPMVEGYSLPSSILDTFHMTGSRFKDFLEAKTKNKYSVEEQEARLILHPGREWSLNLDSPIHYHLFEKSFAISMNKNSSCFGFPELLVHYLLLYNLSMIARYETEWWSELLKTMANDDYPLISQFLNTTLIKGPHLVYEWLTKERFIDV